MEQGPPAVKEKPQVDLFDAILNGAQKDGPGFDPVKYLYTLGRDQRRGMYKVRFDGISAFNKHKDTPLYKGNEDKLKEDIATAKVMYESLDGASVYGKQYKPPTTYMESLGLHPSAQLTRARVASDPYRQHLPGGQKIMAGSETEMAGGRSTYVDRFTGERQYGELGARTKDQRSGMDVLWRMETDLDGNAIEAPILQERKQGEVKFGARTYSETGAQPMTRNPILATLAGYAADASMPAQFGMAAWDNAFGDNSKKRLNTLANLYRFYGAPKKYDTWFRAASTGLFTTDWAGQADPSQMKNMSEEKLFDMIDDFKANEPELRERAKKLYDTEAKLAVDVLDMYEGIYDHGTMDRLLGQAEYLKNGLMWSPSVRAEQQGLFGGLEGFGAGVGQMTAFIQPQGMAARGLASLLVKTGSRAFVSEAVAAGLRPTLTRLGRHTVGLGSALAPTAQMSALVYQGARGVGYSEAEAGRLAIEAMPAIAATEAALSTPYMIKSYIGSGGRDAMVEMVERSLGRELPRSAAKTGSYFKDRLNATGDLFMRNKAAQVAGNFIQWLGKGAQSGAMNTLKNAGDAALREGTQEVLEEMLYAWREHALDERSDKHLFALKQPGSIDYGTRFMQSFLGGALMGGMTGVAMGGKRPPGSYDQTIAAAVADGKSGDILRMAADMAKKGAITEGEHSAIQLDVAVSQQVMKGMNVADPHFLQHIQGQEDLTRSYAMKSADILARSKVIADLQEKALQPDQDKTSIEREIADLNQRQTADKNEIQQILDGTEAMRRLKNSAMQLQSVRGGDGRTFSVEAVDALSEHIRSYITTERERITEGKSLRGQLTPQIGEKLQALTGAKPNATIEALNELTALHSQLAEKGALTKEDVRAFRKAIQAKQTMFMKDLLDLPWEKAPEGSQDLTYGQRAAANNLNTGQDASDFVLNTLKAEFQSGEAGDDGRELHGTIGHLSSVEQSLGRSDDDFEANISSLRDNKRFDGESTQALVLDRLKKVQYTTGQLYDAEERLRNYQKRKSATQEDLTELGAIISQLELSTKALDAYRGPLAELAERVNGSELQRIVSSGREGAVPKAFKDLDADNAQVYQMAKGMSEQDVASLKDILAGLQKESARLGLSVEERSKRLSMLDSRHLAIEARLLDAYLKGRVSEKGNKDLVDAYVAFQQAMESGELKKADELSARVRALVSKELMTSPGSLAKVVSGMLAPLKIEGASSWYWDASWLMGTEFDEWYKADLFTPGDHWVGESGAVQLVMNWVSELARTDHATLLHAYDNAINTSKEPGQIPNSEQQRQVLHAASFLNNPKQEITDDIVTANNQAAKDHLSWTKHKMQRSLLLTGSQGVGKSASVPFIVETLSKLKGRALNIAIFTPGTANGTALKSAISGLNPLHQIRAYSADLTGRIAKFPDLDLIIVDEAHTLSPKHAEDFKRAMEQNGVSPALFIGDHNQVPSLSDKSFVLPVQKMMMRTVPITTSFRHGDVESIALMDHLEPLAFGNIHRDVSEFTLPATRYTEGHEAGVRLIDTDRVTDLIDAFAEHVIKDGHLDISLIVLDEVARKEAITRLGHNADFMGKVPMAALENLVRTMDKGPHSILGGSVKTAFVAFGGEGLGPSYARFLYTAIGRATDSSVVMFRGGRSTRVDSLPKVFSDKNALSSMWAASRDRSKRIIRSAGPPAMTPATGPKKPRPPKPAPDPEENSAFQKGADAYLRGAFLKSAAGKAFRDFKGKRGTVVSSNGNTVRVDFGSKIVEVQEKHLQDKAPRVRGEKPVDQPEPPKDGPQEGDMLDGTSWSLPVIEPSEESISTRLSMRHSMSQRWVGAFPGTLTYDATQKQFSKENPAMAWRLKVLELISGNSKARVKLLWRKNGSYYAKDGSEGRGSAYEVHLTEDSRPLLETARKQLRLKVLPENATMIGSMAIDTYDTNSSFAAELRQMHKLAESTEDGAVLKGYESLPIAMWLEGLYIKPVGDDKGPGEGLPATQLIDNLRAKGWLVSDPQFAWDAWSYSDDKDSKMPGVYVEVRAFEGAPPTRVLLKTKPVDGDYYQYVGRNLDTWIGRQAEKGTIDPKQAEKALAYKLLQWNRARLTSEGAFRNPALAEHLDVEVDKDSGKTYIDFKPGQDYKQRLETLRTVMEILQKSDKSLTQVVTKAEERSGAKGFDKINPDDWSRMLSDVTDVMMPEMYIGFDGIKAETGTAPAMSLNKNIRRRRAKSGTGSEGNRRRCVQEVENYYRKVFGNKWVDGQLEFKSTVTDEFGRELWGMMENGRIFLERAQGTIAAGTERHEAVHRVLDYLLDSQTRNRFLNEAKDKLSESKGISYWQVSDEAAHEFIAEQYENPKYETTTLFGRFMRWLKGVMARWGVYRQTIDDLLWQIEEGRFRDAEELHHDPVVRASRKKKDDGDTEQLSLLHSLQELQQLSVRDEQPTEEQVRVSGFRDRMALSAIFGPAGAQSIVAEAAQNLIVGGPYQHSTDQNLMHSMPSLKAAVDQYWRLIKDEASRQDPYVMMEDGRKLMFDDIPTEFIPLLDDASYYAYRVTRMATEVTDEDGNSSYPVYNSVIQSVFPGIDVERMMNGEHQVDGEGDYHTDMDALEGMSAMVHDTNDQLRPFDRASGLTKLLLSNMRLINYREDADSEAGPEELANLDLLLKVGYKAAQGVVYGHRPGESLHDTFRRKLKELADADFVEKQTPAGKVKEYQPTAEGRHAYSLYKRFLDPDGHFVSGSGHKTYSYAYLEQQAEVLRSETTDPDRLKALNARIDMAERINNNVVRSLIEVSTASNMLSEFTEGEWQDGRNGEPGFMGQGRLKHQWLRFEGTDAVRQEINEATDRLLLPRGTTDIGIDPDMREKFLVGLPTDKPSAERLRFRIDSRGVEASDGTWIARYEGKETSLATDSPEVLQAFFRAAGYAFSTSTLERLTKGGLDNAQVKRGLLARAVGAWSAAIHGAIHQVETGSVPTFAEGIMATERKRSGTGSRSRAEIHGNFDVEEDEGQAPPPAISDFFTLNGELARMESRSRGTEYSRRFINAQGNAEQSDTLGSYFKRIFPALGSETHSSSVVENMAEELLQRDPALRKGTRWLNPLLDKDASPRISEVFFFKGLRTRDRSRAFDVRGMTDLDSERVMLDQFMTGILENWDAERILVPGHTYGDRNVIPIFRLDNPGGGGRRMFLMDKGAKGFSSVKFNHAITDKRIAEQFIYHKQLQEQSLQRWAPFIGINQSIASFDAELGKGAAFDVIEEQLRIMSADPSLVAQVLASPDLMENRDYKVKGGVLSLGNAALMNVGVYTDANYKAIEQANAQGAEALRATIAGIFDPHIERYKQTLRGNKEQNTPGLGWSFSARVRRMVPQGDHEQLLEGYVYLQHLVDAWTSQVITGPVQNYKDFEDWTKRSVMPMSPGHLGNFKHVPRMAFVTDPDVGQKQGRAEPFDGQGWTTPWGYLLGREAFGGPEGVMRETVNKRAYVSSDLIVKYAEVLVSPQYYRQNEYVKGLIQRALPPELLAVWNSSQDETPEGFWKAAQAVIDQAEQMGIADQLIHVISSHHNVKMGRRAMNVAEGIEPLQSVQIDPRNWVLQTNLERSLTDLRAPYPTQITAIMGLLSHNMDRSQKIAGLEAMITQRFIDGMITEIGMEADDTVQTKQRKVAEYFKKQGLAATADRGDVGQLVEALMDPQVSVNDPIVKSKLVQILANHLNTRGINPKLGGQMFNQASGYGLTFALPEEPAANGSPESGGVPQSTDPGDTGRLGSSESGVAAPPAAIPDNGQSDVPNVTSQDGAAESSIGTPEGAAAPASAELPAVSPEAEATGAEMPDGQTAGDQQSVPGTGETTQQLSGLRPPRIEGGRYVPGDVIMPFLYAREFGFKGNEWKDLSLAQIREDIQLRLGDEAALQFDKTLTVYVSRTPSSNVSGGHVMIVREFINDSGNTLFIPPDLNNYTGGDQDGDQLTVLIHRFEGGSDNINDPKPFEPGTPYEQTSKQQRQQDIRALQNQLREQIIGYYTEQPENAALAFLQTGTKRLVQAKETIMAGKATDPLDRTPFMPMGVLASRRAVFDGASLIGIVAQAIKGYSFLSQAWNAVEANEDQDVFKRWVPTDKDHSQAFYVIDNLSELLNGALDNVKLMALGPLGVNPDNIGVVIGAILRGSTLEEALALPSDPELIEAVRKVQRNRSITLDGTRTKSGTLLGNLAKAENQSLLESAALFEAVSDVTRIFNLNVNGMPVEEGEILDYQYKTGKTMTNSRALSAEATDQLVASFFEPGKVVAALRNISGFKSATDMVDGLFRTEFLSRHPVFEGVRQQALQAMGAEGSFGRQWNKVYDEAVQDAMVSLFVNLHFDQPITLNEDLPKVDLTSSGGMFRYAIEFPRAWQEMLDRVMRLPENDPRKVEMRQNTFLEELKVTGGRTPRLEVKDGRRFSDPVARDMVRRDVERLSDVFTGKDILGDWDMDILGRLALYSLIKDRFSYGRNSIMPFLPVDKTRPFGMFLDEVQGSLDQPNGAARFKLSGGGQMTIQQILEQKLLPALPYHYDALVQRGKPDPKSGRLYWKSSVKRGLQRAWQVHRVGDDPKDKWVITTSRLAPPISMIGESVVKNGQALPGLDYKTHLELLRGEAVSLQLDRDQGIKAGQLYLPTGAVADVTEVKDGGRSITMRVPSSANAGSLDQEPSGAFHDTFVMTRETSDYHGRENRKLDGLDMAEGLKRIARLSPNPQYKAIAERLLAHLAISPRSGTIKITEEPGGNRNAGGYITYDGNIELNARNDALGSDYILLHEAGHRFTKDVFGKPYASLTAAERVYVDGITGLYQEVKRLLPEDTDYYLSDVKEFATAAWTSPDFQEKLQSLSSDESGPGIWDRIVNFFRGLLGLGTTETPRNGYVARVMDLTDAYVNHADSWSFRSSGAGHFNPDIRSHGMREEAKPITDIKDLATRLLTPKDAVRNVDEMEFEKLLKHVYSSINWTRNRQIIAGQEINISDNSAAGKAAVLKLLREDVVPRMHGYSHRKKTALVDVLNKGGSWKDWSEAFKKHDGTPIDTEENVRLMLAAIDHQSENVYLRWSDLADPTRVITKQDGTTVKVGDLGLKHVPMFNGYDPVISVRKSQNGLLVNLVEMTSENLTSPAAGGKIKHLLGNYMSGTVLNNVMNARVTNDVGGVKAFMLGLQAMAFKQANPSVAFPRIQVVQMNGEGFKNEGVWMPDMLSQIKAMRDHTALSKELPEGIRAVIADEKLYDGLSYNQSMSYQYGEWLKRDRPDSSHVDHYAHLRTLDAQEKYLSSPEGGKKHYYHMLVNRQQMMIDQYRNEKVLLDNEEYRMISQALYEIDTKDILGTNSDIDIGMWGKFWNNPANYGSDILQWGKDRIKTSNAKVAMLSFREHQQHIEKIKELEKLAMISTPERWAGKVVETGWKRFEPLWRKSTTDKAGKGLRVHDARTGELVEANLNMLHWDRNDPETAQLLRDGTLTQAHLDYANWLLDRIREKLIDLTVHGYRQRMKHVVAGKFEAEKAREKAQQEVDAKWRRGWVPILSRGKGEAFMQGQLGQTLKAIGRQMSNLDSIYEDDFHKGGDHDAYRVANRYLSELGSENPSELGSDIRLERMGVKSFADGRMELHDADRNNGSTRNLEAIMTYFTVAAHRQIVHESETLPVVNAAMAVMHAMDKEGGKGQENNLDLLKDYSRRLVYGEAPADTGINIFGASVTPASRMLMTATTYGGVALNWKVAAASMMYNNLAYWSTARANGLANNGFFGMKSATRAVKECSVANPAGNRKMRALMIHLFVNEMQEGDVLNNERYNRTGSQVFTSHGMQFMNWWGDYMIRGNVMAAQMIEEGSWDAYSLNDKGEVIYDQYKDRRWYNADGTKVPDADIKMKWVRDRVRDQGIHSQSDTGKLTVGHDTRMGLTFKWLADKYVIGGVDASEKVYANSAWWGQLLLQFRQFLPSKIYNWQGRRIGVTEGGSLQVKDGMAVWEKREIQSYLGAVVKGLRLLKDAKEMGVRESFKRFDKADQFAAWKLAHDMVMMALMYALYLGVSGAADENKKRRARGAKGHPLLYDNRVLTMFQQGAFDSIGGSFAGVAYTIGKPQSAVPALSTAYRMWTAILGGQPEKLLDNLPGKKTFDTIAEQTAAD